MTQTEEKNAIKATLAYLRSIDKSLGRIANALEERNKVKGVIKNENDEEVILWHPGYTTLKKED